MTPQDIAREIETQLTDADIEAWHNGELTANTEALVEKYGAFQVWGSNTGSEPLSVIYPA